MTRALVSRLACMESSSRVSVSLFGEVSFPLSSAGFSATCFGAGGMGDIGRHFPDSDERYKDADSTALLLECISIARIETVINADITVIAQQPRLAGYTERIRNSVASLLGCAPDRVNIKATTEEGLGFTGRKEGMAVHAVVLVILKENGK